MSNRTTSGFELTWGQATDSVTPAGLLEYRLVTAASHAAIDTVAEAASLSGPGVLMDWSAATLVKSLEGLGSSERLFLALLVRDKAQLTSLYPLAVGTTRDVTAPSAGTSVAVSSIDSTSAVVSWGSASDDFSPAEALEYRILISQDCSEIDTISEAAAQTGSSVLQEFSASPLPVTASGLADGTDYCVGALVRDQDGNRALYAPVTFSTLDSTVPSVGSQIVVTGMTTSTIDLSWGAATDNVTSQPLLEYKVVKASTLASIDTVQEAQLVAAESIVQNWSANDTSHQISGLNAGEQVAVTVLVRDQAGHIGIYPPQSLNSLPDAPSNVAASAGNGQVTVSWEASPGSTGYDLYFSTSSGAGTGGTRIADVTSPFIHTGRPNGTTVYYVVVAVNNGFASSASQEATATPNFPTVLQTEYSRGINPQSGKKTLTDSVFGYRWAFAATANGIFASASADGSSWSAPVSTGLVGTYQEFSVSYAQEGGVPYVLIAAIDRKDAVLARGALGAGVVTFGTAITVLQGNSTVFYHFPTVTVSTTGQVWFGAISYTGVTFAAQIRESVATVSGDLDSWLAAHSVGGQTTHPRGLSLLPLSAARIAAVMGQMDKVRSFVFDGTEWSEQSSGGDFSWLSIDGAPGFRMASDVVYAIAVMGSDLYVGGRFNGLMGGQGMQNVARWDGSRWNALGSGLELNNTVNALAVMGGVLFVGGSFNAIPGVPDSSRLARWDGSGWSGVPGASLSGQVYALASANGVLYVGGSFTNAGGIAEADRVARWTGSAWQALGAGVSGGTVRALHVSGNDVYVGGSFTAANGMGGANNIMCWDGSDWLVVGSNGLPGEVRGIAEAGGVLYVGGLFLDAGGDPAADYLVRWTGSAWARLGGGVSAAVYGLSSDGTNLFVAGAFFNVNGGALTDDKVGQWNGSTWVSVGSNGLVNDANVVLYENGMLHVGGNIPSRVQSRNVSAGTWKYHSLSGAPSLYPYDMVFFDGKLVVATGTLGLFGITGANCVAAWSGTQWSALGNGLSGGIVFDLEVADGKLYAAGSFTSASGVPGTSYLAYWDGSVWNSVTAQAPNSSVTKILINGPDLFASGPFSAVGSTPADKIARCDGTQWHALGPGLSHSAKAMTMWQGDLYVGGDFTDAGGLSSGDLVAGWSGTTGWFALGSGIPKSISYSVSAMEVYDNKLFVGGDFLNAGGVASADYVASWNGTSWSALAPVNASQAAPNGDVRGFYHDNGYLYASGTFTTIKGSSCAQLAYFDGTDWFCSALAPGVEGRFAFQNGQAYGAFNGAFHCSSTVARAGVERFDAVVDSSDVLHLALRLVNVSIVHQKWEGGSWSVPSTLVSSGGTEPQITYDPDSDRAAVVWRQSDGLSFKRMQTGTWDTNPSPLSLGAGLASPNCSLFNGPGAFWCAVLNLSVGSASPFSVLGVEGTL